MQHSLFTKVLSGFLSFVLLFGGISVLPASAAESEADVIADLLTDIPFHDNLATGAAGQAYLTYLEKHQADGA